MGRRGQRFEELYATGDKVERIFWESGNAGSGGITHTVRIIVNFARIIASKNATSSPSPPGSSMN